MDRELHRISGDTPGERLIVTRLDTGHIAYEYTGIGELGTLEVIAKGTVHNPGDDDREGARRILTAMPTTRMREKLDTETRERVR